MKINITFTGKEKRAINSFIEACGYEGDDVFEEVTNYPCDQIEVRGLKNGGIITIDDSLVVKVIRFCESKIGAAKMVYHLFKETIDGYVDLMKKNISHKRTMVDHAKKDFTELSKKCKDVRYIFAFRTEHMMNYRIVTDQHEFIIPDEDIIEAVLCDKLGMVSDELDEIKLHIDDHNKNCIHNRMIRNAEHDREDHKKFDNKNMVAELCCYDKSDEIITHVPITENEIIKTNVFDEIRKHDMVMLAIFEPEKYCISDKLSIARWMHEHNISIISNMPM